MGSAFIKYLKNSFSLFISLALSILFFFFIFKLESLGSFFADLFAILSPFIYGAVIAYILRPVCNFFEEKIMFVLNKITSNKIIVSLASSLSVILSISLGIIAFYLFFAMVIPQIFESITMLIKNAPTNLENVQKWLENHLSSNEMLRRYASDITVYITEFVNNWIEKDLMPSIQTIINGVSSGVVSVIVTLYNVFIGTIVAIYLLAGRKKLLAQAKLIFHSVIKKKYSNVIIEEIKYADNAFSSFINGKLLASLIIGIICFIFTLLTNMPYGMLISVIIAVTNMIPFFGPFIGDIPAFLLVVLIDPIKAVTLLIFLIVLQQFEGNVLTPRILGNSIGLPGLWILFSIILFGGLFGFLGMIIGIPAFAVIYDIIKRIVHLRLKKNRNEQLLQEYNAVYHNEEDL